LNLDQDQFSGIDNFQIQSIGFLPPLHSLQFPTTTTFFTISKYNDNMKFTTTLALLGAFMAQQALATFNYGYATYNDGHKDNAIWVDGENQCDYAYLGHTNESPCSYNGGWFELNNIWYDMVGCSTDQGCSGTFCVQNSDGSENACATYYPAPTLGPCYNSYGTFYVTQIWQFGPANA
jgi:hypothetical protein